MPVGATLRRRLNGMKKLREVGAGAPTRTAGRLNSRGGPECFEGLTLQFQVTGGVPAGCRDADVAELISDDREINPGLQQRDSARMTQQMRPYFPWKMRIGAMKSGSVIGDDSIDAVAGQRLAIPLIAKESVVCVCGLCWQQQLQGGERFGPRSGHCCG